MIESTLCHLPHVSLAEEKNLWRKGICNWDDLQCWAAVHADDARYQTLEEAIARSRRALASQDVGFFLKNLPESEYYRIYPDFARQVFFLDIETDGLDQDAEITCLSVLNMDVMRSYLCTDDFGSAERLLGRVRIAVTFHGTRFDMPRLMRRFPDFRVRFHIDLARTLRFHKVSGGLKDVALRLGWRSNSNPSTITNGQQAAEAWHSYQQSADSSILRDLQAYNQEDVQMLRFIICALVSRHARSIPL
ncbi:hypothetical protein LCGC14_2333890 [marine sediment metagenome]|uniref:YprB ribonuclease H-like domain-containing protein n=1 Tax=marine sediment metagenome TaxID=412755 RepID=A0A0F9D1H5_9ZZZZ